MSEETERQRTFAGKMAPKLIIVNFADAASTRQSKVRSQVSNETDESLPAGLGTPEVTCNHHPRQTDSPYPLMMRGSSIWCTGVIDRGFW